MSDTDVYLRPDVVAEPLFNQWHAWAYLIPPASAAMYIANSHLKIMQSFVDHPQVHIAALSNPAMIGGPFINYGAERTPAIKQLIAETLTENARMLEFAEGIKALEETLNQEAHGHSLEGLYQRVPGALKGYVELVYDLNNNPSIRFLEGLLYKSKYYNPASQSFAVYRADTDKRPFVLSTPRLEDDETLFLKLPFNHEAVDELARMRSVPRPYGLIREMLGVPGEKEELFASFFMEEKSPAPARYEGEGVRVRYLGHACVLLETKETSIICDPLISYQGRGGMPRFTLDDLPEKIDYVLFTHCHQDHVLFETLLQLRHKIRNVVVPKSSGASRADPSLKLILQTIGFENVWELDEMESIRFADGFLMGLPFLGEHADLNIRTKTAYCVNAKGHSVVLVADSNNLEPALYEHLGEVVGEVSALFIGMECDGAPMSWLYGPLLSKPLSRKDDQSRRFDGSDFGKSFHIVEQLKPREVYVYAMGQEPWCTFLTSIKYTPQSRPIVESDKLTAACAERGIRAERLFGTKELFLEPR